MSSTTELRETFDYRAWLEGRPEPVAMRWPELPLDLVRKVEVLCNHGRRLQLEVPRGRVPVFRMRRKLNPLLDVDERLAFLALYDAKSGEVRSICWITPSGRTRWSRSWHHEDGIHHPPEFYPNEARLGLGEPRPAAS